MKLGERSLGFETRKSEGRDKVWQYGSWEQARKSESRDKVWSEARKLKVGMSFGNLKAGKEVRKYEGRVGGSES